MINYCNRCVHYVEKKPLIRERCALNDPDFGGMCGNYNYDFQRFRLSEVDESKDRKSGPSRAAWRRALSVYQMQSEKVSSNGQ